MGLLDLQPRWHSKESHFFSLSELAANFLKKKIHASGDISLSIYSVHTYVDGICVLVDMCVCESGGQRSVTGSIPQA